MLDQVLGRTRLGEIFNGTPCWLWVGTLVRGYGTVRIQQRMWRVHRFVYTNLVGPIPDGLQIEIGRAHV